VVEKGITLSIVNPKPTTYLWLKLANCGNSPSRIIVRGDLTMDSVRVSSWDTVLQTFREDATEPRGYIRFDGGTGIIQHCRLEHLGYASASRDTHGIATMDCSEGVRLYDNTIMRGFQGINIKRSSDVFVSGNIIEKPFDTGILMEYGSHDCDILSNIVNSSGRHGIMVFGECSDCAVSYNTLSANANHGIKICKDCKNMQISDNIAKDNLYKGIVLFACKDMNITNNIVINGTGIAVSHKSSGITISDNRVINATTAIGLIGTIKDIRTVREAIDVSYEEFEVYSEYNIVSSMYGDVSKCVVTRNDIRGCINDGVKVCNSHHNKISRNTITDSDRFGINIIESWECQFADNEIDRTGESKYNVAGHSPDNTLVKSSRTYALTDRGCVSTAVDLNRNGFVDLDEFKLLIPFVIEEVTGWFR